MSRLESAWEALSASSDSSATGFGLQLVESTGAIRVYAAWGGAHQGPGLLVELPAALRNSIRSQWSTRAFSVQVADFPGLAPDRIGVMTSLSDGAYADLFGLLCSDLRAAACSAPTEATAGTALRRVMDRWRHFIERRSAPLSAERVRGLIGESVVLGRLIGRVGPLEALAQWTGPHDALRDFELDDASVEVKTYQAQTGSSVRISAPGQLEATSGRPVYLAVVELALNASNGRTLPDMVALLSQMVSVHPGGADLLEEKLAQYGYMNAHASMYTEAFVVGSTVVFAITDGFPRLSVAAIPPGVDDVQFSVRLTGLSPFKMDHVCIIGAASPLETAAS